MDYFDLAKQFNGNLSDAFKDTKAKFFVISFTSDWLYPTQENKDIVIALTLLELTLVLLRLSQIKGMTLFYLMSQNF